MYEDKRKWSAKCGDTKWPVQCLITWLRIIAVHANMVDMVLSVCCYFFSSVEINVRWLRIIMRIHRRRDVGSATMTNSECSMLWLLRIISYSDDICVVLKNRRTRFFSCLFLICPTQVATLSVNLVYMCLLRQRHELRNNVTLYTIQFNNCTCFASMIIFIFFVGDAWVDDYKVYAKFSQYKWITRLWCDSIDTILHCYS